MSSWVPLLLLVALAACVQFGVAEGDPLPAALVELVRNSPVSSIEDLQLLLLSDSVGEEDGDPAAAGGHRLRRSLNAQPAQQALCKVRPEVVEVTRAMLDRSNANFMLWPPCVEVQRCSGCCNTESLRCVAVATHTRYLQVMKIEYINKRPAYAKAVVSVVDHVECRCQPAPAPRKKSSRRQHGQQHRNQTLSPGHEQAQVKFHSKDELHQWDELKQNQRTRLEDLLDQHWSSRGDAFPPAEGYSLPGEGGSQRDEAALWAPNSTRLQQTETPEDGNQTGLLLDVTPNPQPAVGPAQETRSRFRPTKEPNPDPRGPVRGRSNETPDEARTLEVERTKVEQERKELLLLHKRLDEEKELLRREEEERQRTKQADSRPHLHGQRHRQPTTTHSPASTTAARKPPARPSQTRRRTRKNRKRISKAAMRAMLM